ncbi:MAG: hypothetical protein LBH03_02125 [Holophagales bacterium]|jgi:hypothetical protein|nr:hypothetical protein [Holophagales bacterium]
MGDRQYQNKTRDLPVALIAYSLDTDSDSGECRMSAVLTAPSRKQMNIGQTAAA